jgi:hypothetical protein
VVVGWGRALPGPIFTDVQTAGAYRSYWEPQPPSRLLKNSEKC